MPFWTIWEWTGTVLSIESKGWACFKISPPVVCFLFRGLSICYNEKCYWDVFEENIVSHAVKIVKQTSLHITFLTKRSKFWLKGKTINETGVVTNKFMICLMCLTSNIVVLSSTAGKFAQLTDIHTDFTMLFVTFSRPQNSI